MLQEAEEEKAEEDVRPPNPDEHHEDPQDEAPDAKGKDSMETEPAGQQSKQASSSSANPKQASAPPAATKKNRSMWLLCRLMTASAQIVCS